MMQKIEKQNSKEYIQEYPSQKHTNIILTPLNPTFV